MAALERRRKHICYSCYVLKQGLRHEQVYQSRKYGRAFVKFEKVWDATGCEIALNGEKLFGGSTISVARVLENDLPDNVKAAEARDRVKA